MVFEAEFGDRVEGFEAGFFDRFLIEGITVDDDCRIGFQPAGIGFECGGIHGHQHVAIVTRVDYPVASEVNLETRNA